MRVPTTAELDALFIRWGEDAFERELKADVRQLYKEARSSERIRGLVQGFGLSLLRSMTAAGIDVGPVLSVFLMGFRMGALYQEREGGPQAREIDEWLKGLDTSLPPEERKE